MVLVHASAHRVFVIDMSWPQNAFIGLFVIAAPIVAGGLVWTSCRRAGAFLLAASMFAALVFGLSHHFLVPGTDNIASVPAAGWGARFRLSAFLLAIVEAWGSAVGWWGIRCFARAPS
ncbi:MAG: hypothetical protein D6826_09185 [Alphaproteobacteria bacterium]|nr:MAG: hypothetical protein D6826_09185 [Alphaproteobacteria bacterium]